MRVKFFGLLELGNRRVEIILEFECEAEIVVELRIVRLDREAGAELLDGVVEIGLLEVSDAQIFAQRRTLLIQSERAHVEGNRALRVAGLHESEAEVCECGEILWPGRNDFTSG